MLDPELIWMESTNIPLGKDKRNIPLLHSSQTCIVAIGKYPIPAISAKYILKLKNAILVIGWGFSWW
jgi:hypothetical protein